MHLNGLNQNEIKKIWDKRHTQGMESAPQCKDPAHEQTPDKQQLFLEEPPALLMAETGFTNAGEHVKNRQQSQCTKLKNCACAFIC